MDCPACGYALSSFEKECPRCRNFKAKGLAPALLVRATPEPVAEPVPAAPPPRPVRNITPEPVTAAAGGIAPLVIYTNRRVRWQPWAMAAVVLLVAGLFAWWQTRQAAITKAIVLAARQGACERMPGFDTDRQVAACTQLTGAFTYHVVRDAPEHAVVTFFLSGMASSLNVVVNQDDEGDWHAVSADTGDEGSRTPWSARRFNDPPPPVASTAPTEPAPVTLAAPANNYPSVPTAPAPDTLPGNGASDTNSYTMHTQAGGGPPPNL